MEKSNSSPSDVTRSTDGAWLARGLANRELGTASRLAGQQTASRSTLCQSVWRNADTRLYVAMPASGHPQFCHTRVR